MSTGNELLTLFTTLKPMRGRASIAQYNALTSWSLLSDCQLFIIGDDEGAEKLAQEIGARFIPDVARMAIDAGGPRVPLLDSLFETAEANAVTPLLAYVNADIMLTDSLVEAARELRYVLPRFLMIGQRYDVEVPDRGDFTGDWEAALHHYVYKYGTLHQVTGVDYFVYPRGFWSELWPFAMGQYRWDNVLIAAAVDIEKAPVVDATNAVLAVHQNHPVYAHDTPGAAHNRKLVPHIRLGSIDDATHRVVNGQCIEIK